MLFVEDFGRRTRIGGTAMTSIMGVNKYQSRDQVLGYYARADPGPKDYYKMEWGRRLEDPVAIAYAEKNDCRLMDPAQEVADGLLPGPVVVHPDYDFLAGTPDRFVYADKRYRYRTEHRNGNKIMRITGGLSHGLEVKTSNAFKEKYILNKLDDTWIIQGQYYMLLTGLDRWDFAVLCGGQVYCDPTHFKDETVDWPSYSLKADPFLHAEMIDKAIEFWEEVKNVRKKK